jgi:hypothetical protein
MPRGILLRYYGPLSSYWGMCYRLILKFICDDLLKLFSWDLLIFGIFI